MMLEILRKKLNKMVALEYPAALSQTMDKVVPCYTTDSSK